MTAPLKTRSRTLDTARMRVVRLLAVLVLVAVLLGFDVVGQVRSAGSVAHAVEPDIDRVDLAQVAREADPVVREESDPETAHDHAHGLADALHDGSADPTQGRLDTGGPTGEAEPESWVEETIARVDDRPEVLTAEIAADGFDVLGVTWDAGSTSPLEAVVTVRVREQGEWSDWTVLPPVDGAPDDGTAEAAAATGDAATEPLVVGGADRFQVRIDTVAGVSPDGVEAVVVDGGESAADPGAAAGTLSSAGAAQRPGVVTRDRWGADESLRSCNPEAMSRLKAGTVHHTAGTNSYQPGDSAGIVRGIYAYHTRTLGWCDIGYNFLVDKYGQIFEGRLHSVNRPTLGAHAGGFNQDTVGVATMGEYTSAGVTGPMAESVSRVLAWQLDAHGVDPQGSTSLTSQGGGTSRYAAGTTVTLPTIFGHRDVGSTGCPGDNLYGMLTSIRLRVAELMYPTPVLAPADVVLVSPGSSTSLSSARTAPGRPVSFAVSPTALGGSDPTSWRFFAFGRGGLERPDLVAVKVAGSGSGRVEVHTLTGDSNYTQFSVHAATPLPDNLDMSQWQFGVGSYMRSGRPDLFAIRTVGGASGRMEVHTLSAASNYQQWVVHAATPLRYVGANAGAMLVGDDGQYGDVSLILFAQGTGSGRTEVHRLDARSNYSRFNLQTGTALGPVSPDSVKFSWGDWGNDGRLDLWAVPTATTGTGAVELHVVDGGSNFANWALHATTNAPLSASTQVTVRAR